MNLDEFQSLPTKKFQKMVRELQKVCLFPTKGTRRWFAMQYPDLARENFVRNYLKIVGLRHLELYKMFFDHGINTLIAPMFDRGFIENRNQEYLNTLGKELIRIANHSDWVDFYDKYQVRVRFYGDYRRVFAPTPFAHFADIFDECAERTRTYDRQRIFYGIFAQDSTEAAAEMAVKFHSQHGKIPDKRALIEMYYGEDVSPVDFVISFGKPRIFDAPLLLAGKTDLYFMVSPSLSLTKRQLRMILYDHLFARITTVSRPSVSWWETMRAYYQINTEKTLGLGTQQGKKVWCPLPQVDLPDDGFE